MNRLIIVLFLTLVTHWNEVYCDINVYENYTLVSLVPTTEEQLLSLVGFESPSKDIQVMKPSRFVRDSYDLLVPPNRMNLVKTYAEKHELQFQIKKSNYGRSLPSIDREPKRRSSRSFNVFTFNSNAAIQEYLEQLAKKHPDVLTLENIGKSYEKRTMRLAKISAKPSANNPIMLFDAGIHSREWVAPAMAVYTIHRLVTDPEARKTDLKDVDWYILPLVNPDGYEYTRASTNNRMWRKTRAPNGKCFGADGNRNYDFKWAVSGVSKDPCHTEIFPGTKPFSEVETRAVRNVMKKYADRLKLYVSLHAYGQYLVYPWGYTGNYLPDSWKKLHRFARTASDAVVKAGGDPFTVMSAGQWYPAAGGSDDYSFGAIGVPYAYTMELTKGHDFVFPSELLRDVLPQFYAGFQSFGDQIKQEFHPGKHGKRPRAVAKQKNENGGDEYDFKL